MGWKTLVITNKCKLSYKNDYLIIRKESIKMVHLSEIDIIIVDSGQVSITSYLISELSKSRIKIIFVDEKHNPICEIVPYYGCFNTSKKILNQINWKTNTKEEVWKKIIQYKIYNQYRVLTNTGIKEAEKLLDYMNDVEPGDKTNREGHAAKVYFNLLFGNNFVRHGTCNINVALDYGYSILLSVFNKEVVSRGYITQIGVNHKNEFNFFNFACDLMEPYRSLVDEYVYSNKDKVFDKEYKISLINILNKKVKIDGKSQYLGNAISVYVKSVLDSLDNPDNVEIFNYEL